MDRDTTLRTLAAIALSLAVIIAWRQMFPVPEVPPEPLIPAAEETVETLEPDGPAQLTRPAADPWEELSDTPTAGQEYEIVEAPAGSEPVVIATPSYEAVFSPRGARLMNLRLNSYELNPGQRDGSVVDLVSPESRRLDRHPLVIEVGDPDLQGRINESWYRLERGLADPDLLAETGFAEGSELLTFRYEDGQGLAVRKRIVLPSDDSYLIWVDWSIEQAGRPVPDARLTWGPSLMRPLEDASSTRYAYRGQAVVANGGKVKRYMPGKLSGDLSWDGGSFPRWIALDSQYFAVAVVPAEPAPAAVRSVPVTGPDGGEAEPQLLLEAGRSPVILFAGPKSSRLLGEIDESLGTDLKELVHWGFFGVIARPLYTALSFLERGVGNWGVAIILLTFVIKVLFFPLTQRAMVNMRRTQEKMGKLQPKVRKIREKYRDKKDMESRRKMQEDMMGLYKAEGVNPMAPVAGCLPLLLQLPVLYGMYTLLTVTLEMRGAPFFGWITDMSAADPYFITPVVMGVTMLGQQLLSLTKVEDPQQKAQQRMMLIMPVMFTYFFIWLPSGLVLYWLTNNVLGIAQQVLINRQAAAARSAEAAVAAKPGRASKTS